MLVGYRVRLYLSPRFHKSNCWQENSQEDYRDSKLCELAKMGWIQHRKSFK